MQINQENIVDNFLIKYSGYRKKIIIYGAGHYGKYVWKFLKKSGISVDFFAVTEAEYAAESIDGISVLEIGYLRKYNKDSIVLVAVKAKEWQQEIMKLLREFEFENVKLVEEEDIALLGASKWFVSEEGLFCPVCGKEVKAFAIIEDECTEDYYLRCPVCRSGERHRALWEYLRENKILAGEKRVLHFAPEYGIYNNIKNMKNIDYYPVDISERSKIIRERVDITSIPYEDNFFDIIICSHVLEHVKEERRALEELLRVLKVNGKAFIITPFEPDREKTLECETYNTPELRKKYYGLEDHVRLNGIDYFDRLAQAGFLVDRKIPFSMCSEEFLRRHGLDREEEIDICMKMKD